jgi:hypothetical protein
VVRALVPRINLDDLFEQKNDVAKSVLQELEKVPNCSVVWDGLGFLVLPECNCFTTDHCFCFACLHLLHLFLAYRFMNFIHCT